MATRPAASRRRAPKTRKRAKKSRSQGTAGREFQTLVDIMALDMTSGKMARAEIHRASGLSEEEIAREAAYVRSLQIQ